MVEYSKINVEFSDSQFNYRKFAVKNWTGITSKCLKEKV